MARKTRYARLATLEGQRAGAPILHGTILAADGVTVLGQGLADDLMHLNIDDASATILTFFGPIDGDGAALVMHWNWQAWRDITLAWRVKEAEQPA